MNHRWLSNGQSLSALGIALVAAHAATGPAWGGGDGTVVRTWVGGGGHGEPVVETGVWSFDILSPEQRMEPLNCQNTLFRPFGEIVQQFDWQAWPDSTVPPRLEFVKPDPTGAEQEVGGGVLVFNDPGFGGFPPGHLSEAVSPPIPGAVLGLREGDRVEFTFAARSEPVPPTLVFTAALRTMEGGIWSPWEEQEFPILPGTHAYRIPFDAFVGKTTEAVQTKTGVKNDGDEPVPGPGPETDEAKVEVKEESARETKFVPDISQGNEAICQASAFANCLSWWANNGYRELTTGDTQQAKNEKLQADLKKKVHTENKGDVGVTKYLKEKKVFKGQPMQGKRPQLEHVRRSGRHATWSWMKEQFDGGADVLLRLQWYKRDGTLVSADAAHYVTVAQVRVTGTGEDEEKKILVANPWGESHHTVTAENKEDAYETLDATCNDDGTIRVDNEDLETRASGITGAAYLCVESINVIRKVSAGLVVVDSGLRLGPAPGDGGTTLYNYTAANGLSEPLSFFGLNLEVPIESVLSPPGWDWMPMPTLYPGGSGCGAKLGVPGVAWFTTTDPIPPGETLDGFVVEVPSVFPIDDFGALAYFDVGDGNGEFLIGPGPAPVPGDVDGDGEVGFVDLLTVLASWGPCDGCPADIDGDGSVGFTDLLIVLAGWTG